ACSKRILTRTSSGVNPQELGRAGRTPALSVLEAHRTNRGVAVFDLEEREVARGAAGMWWVFLLTGIAWLVFAILVFQWDYTTVYAVSYLFGFVALIAGLNEFFSLGIWTTGWKILHGIVGAIFIAVGIWALVHPHNAFATLAALVAFFLLFKGIFDIVVSFVAKEAFELWWLQLVLGIIEV